MIWLENLNLRGSYKAVIMEYIRGKYPKLLSLYREIYQQGNRSYWELLDEELKIYAAKIGLDYVRNDDSMKRPFDAPPVIVNYFYHEQIKKSADLSLLPLYRQPYSVVQSSCGICSMNGCLMDEDENFIIDEETAPVVRQMY